MFTKKKRPPSAIEVLQSSNPWRLSEKERVEMTVSCRDSDYIPKVKDAGKVYTQDDGSKVQIMHNGLKVVAGGYYGTLIEEITTRLNGHHEPQEEKVFNEILKRISGKKPVMIELGSFWAYYSMWFKHSLGNTLNICCEPDPQNIKLGIKNMEINGFKEGKNLIFHNVAAGKNDLEEVSFEMDSSPGEKMRVQIQSVDGIAKREKLDRIDILHIDVQGVELSALLGAEESIKNGLVRFVVVSTHHYVFSGDPLTHQKCKDFLEKRGASIIASHNVVESFSGDGLIVASFDDRDKNFTVDISSNSGAALFRPYEEDIALLLNKLDEVTPQRVRMK